MSIDYRFGFTGTRDGMTVEQKSSLYKFLSGGSGELHHGDCIGADSQAHDVADACGYAVVLHPPTNARWRAFRWVPKHMMRPEAPFLDRNRQIVNETVALIAAPFQADEQPRGGTWSTIRYAKKQGKPTVIIFPDGSIKQEQNR